MTDGEELHEVRLTVNGAAAGQACWRWWPPVRRHPSCHLQLTGTHVGGVCGACTVLLDGVPVCSCLLLAVSSLTARRSPPWRPTEPDGTLSPVQQAFADCHGLQCGSAPRGFLAADHGRGCAPTRSELSRPGRRLGESLPVHRVPQHRPALVLRAAEIQREREAGARTGARQETGASSRLAEPSKLFGASVQRVEDDRLVRGRGVAAAADQTVVLDPLDAGAEQRVDGWRPAVPARAGLLLGAPVGPRLSLALDSARAQDRRDDVVQYPVHRQRFPIPTIPGPAPAPGSGWRAAGSDGDEEARGAEPALQAVAVGERLLHRRQRAVRLGQPLHGGDLRAVGADREQETGADRDAVQQDGAGAAHAVLAAHMGAGQLEVVTDDVGQQPPGRHLDPAGGAVDGQPDLVKLLAVSHRPSLPVLPLPGFPRRAPSPLPGPRRGLPAAPAGSAPRPGAAGRRRWRGCRARG